MSGEGAAPRPRGQVVVLNRDLMFGLRLRNQLRELGFEARFAKETVAFLALLDGGASGVALGIVDMNGPVDWALIRAYVDRAQERPPLLAFGPHVDAAGRRAAKAAGVDRIVSNGDFHRGSADLIRRYARPPRTDNRGTAGDAGAPA